MQLDVFADFVPRARRSDPETSREAGRKVDASGLSARVLAELARGEGTTHELAARLGLSLVTVSPRMAPLRRKGLVMVVGRRDGSQVWGLIQR